MDWVIVQIVVPEGGSGGVGIDVRPIPIGQFAVFVHLRECRAVGVHARKGVGYAIQRNGVRGGEHDAVP